MSDKEVTTRILESDRTKLNDLSSRYSMKASVILGHLIDLGIKHKMLESGWESNLAEQELQEILADMDIEFRKKVELKKVTAQINAKMMVFKEWMKILPPNEKKQFLENVLGDTKTGDFLEKLTNYQMFIVDGEKKLYPVDESGYPLIPFVQLVNILKCARGFHIVNNRCNCRYWESCEYGKAAFESWLAEHGTPHEQQRYLEETSGFRRRYR